MEKENEESMIEKLKPILFSIQQLQTLREIAIQKEKNIILKARQSGRTGIPTNTEEDGE